MAKEKVHMKSPEWEGKTLCGLRLKDVEHTSWRKKITCKSCKQNLKHYD